MGAALAGAARLVARDGRRRLVDGLAALAGRHGVSVVGGNITRTDGPLVVDVTAGGEVARRVADARRRAAGDEI